MGGGVKSNAYMKASYMLFDAGFIYAFDLIYAFDFIYMRWTSYIYASGSVLFYRWGLPRSRVGGEGEVDVVARGAEAWQAQPRRYKAKNMYMKASYMLLTHSYMLLPVYICVGLHIYALGFVYICF